MGMEIEEDSMVVLAKKMIENRKEKKAMVLME